jgi:large subunit ribosomal protein L6
MSRVGKNPIALPSGVEANLAAGQLRVKGKLGESTYAVPDTVTVEVANGAIVVLPKAKTKLARTVWGTTRANLNNIVQGVSTGFTVNLQINGVGYRAAMQGKDLVLQLGYSHEVRFPVPAGITITVENQTQVMIKGANKQLVGQVAAKIRGYREPEPYKGKGIKYVNETILRKEGKKK